MNAQITSPFDGLLEIVTQPAANTNTLTVADLDHLIETVKQVGSEPHLFLISPQTAWLLYWMEEYRKQGKRYPRMRKRKSPTRMSQQWRG